MLNKTRAKKTEGSVKVDASYNETVDEHFLDLRACPVCKIIDKEDQYDDMKYHPYEFIKHLMKQHSKKSLVYLIQEVALNDLFEGGLNTWFV
jgi:hypothetical protein